MPDDRNLNPQPQPQPQPKPGPINVGVAGLGRAFTLMLPTFLRDPRVRLAAACDPREEARRQFAHDFDAPTYDDIDGLAANAEVDVIYIASPHQLHAAQTVAAARGGKHVLVEKPMALTTDDCDTMIEACEAAGVHLLVGHCHSFDTPYLAARRLIGSEELGAVKMIHALNYTDFLYRPRRPEELRTEDGGGVVFSQAAHQVDVVRLLAGSPVVRARAMLGSWDSMRPTEGAYAAMLWFEGGAFASLTYSGYGHFDSDEWCDWTGEMGQRRNPDDYGAARRRLAAVRSGGAEPAAQAQAEAKLKSSSTYGGPAWKAPDADTDTDRKASAATAYQHFGPIIVSCEHADVRPMPDAVWIYGDRQRVRHELALPSVPRSEVIDELYAALTEDTAPFHDGRWARGTLSVCRALLRSARDRADVVL